MRLTQNQVDAMLAKGMSIEDIQREAAYRGDEMPDKRDMLQKTTDVVTKIFPGRQVGESIGTAIATGIAGAKYGKQAALDVAATAPRPSQVLGDVAQGAISIAGAKLPVPGTILGKVGQFGALGAGSGAASGLAEGLSGGDIGKRALAGGIFGGILGLTFGVLEKGTAKAGELIQKQGQRIQLKTINPFKADIDDGFKVETLQKYNLGGSLQQTYEKTDKEIAKLARELNQKLADSPNSVNLNSVLQKTQERLGANKLKNFGSNKTIQEILDDLADEITNVAGKNGLVSVPDAQMVKQAAGQHGAWQYGFTDPKAKATERLYNTFYSVLKEEIEKASPPGVGSINSKLSELIPVMNAVVRQLPKEARSSPIGFQEWLSLGLATVNPGALALGAVSIAQKSGRVGSALVNVGGKMTGTLAKGAGAVARFAQTLGR